MTFNYNSNYIGNVFCVISVPLNKYSFLCKNSSRYFRYSYVKCWHCYFITLFKYDFLYLDSNILNNHLLEVRKSSDSKTSSIYESVKYSSEVTSYLLKGTQIYHKCCTPFEQSIYSLNEFFGSFLI